ncbi:MAG: hypothetical protein E7426_01885 [Ruminococcaceae bacterium]|jgi:hypothetical protein|nr:hypothetical protein [Oscillospiraceae bacterium]
MSDMYEKVQKAGAHERRRPALWIIIVAAVAGLSVLAAIIIHPLYAHRRFMRYIGQLSEDTVYATEADCLRCELADGTALRLTVENAYAVYNKLMVSGRGTHSNDVPAEKGVLLDYGNGATLQLWPQTFTGKGRSEGVFVQYTDAAGESYSYRTNHVSYSNISAAISPQQNPPWEE